MKLMQDMPEMKPMIHLNSKDLPAIKNWKVGGKYKVTMMLKQKSMSIDDRRHSASFGMMKAMPENKEETYENDAVKTAMKARI